jgi:hypothetical protein
MQFDPRDAPPRHRLGSSFESRGKDRSVDPQHTAAALEAAAAAPSVPLASSRTLALGFLAGAVVALLGGLLWAVVVIATQHDIGFVAVLIGAATGLTVHFIARGQVGVFERVLAGVFAAVGILIGRYAVFIHGLNDALHKDPRANGLSVGYFDGQQISYYLHHLGTVLGEDLYWLWILIAAAAAFRISGGGRVLGIGRRRY